MKQRDATQAAHALVYELINEAIDDHLDGFTRPDRERLEKALAQIQLFHYNRSGEWIDPGKPWPRKLSQPIPFWASKPGQVRMF